MRASAFLYPWDVVGDPDAPRRIAELGVEQVTLAAAYHSTRALTPRHPHHRVVTARHAAVLYPPDGARWRRRALRPYPQDWLAGTADPYREAAEALAGAGLAVHSWVVLAHNSRLGEEHPDTSVRNAYGDRYPWAPCIARPEVHAYLRDLAAEAAVRAGTDGTELESCGWYGLAHLHAHDKIGGVALDGAATYLMSLCFCDRCRAGYAGLGADPEERRRAVRRALRPVWTGEPTSPADADHGAGAGDRESGAVGRNGGSEDRGGGAAGRGAGAEGRAGPAGEAGGSAHRGSGGNGRDATAREDDAPGVPGGARAAEWHAVRRLLGDEWAALCAAWREQVAGSLQREVVAAVRAAAGPGFRVLLHADPAPHRCGANAGVRVADVLAHADGLVLPCTGDDAERADVLVPSAAHRPAGRTLAANLTVVSGMGGSPGTLAADAARAAALGADELRLYHAGLASDADLAAVRTALARLR